VKSKQVYFAHSAAICALLLSGCATMRSEDSAVIEKRAVERWNLIIAHQPEKAYDYLSPGFRATKARDVYAKEISNRPVTWESVKFVERKCTPDTCEVQLELGIKVSVTAAAGTRPIETTAPVKENWIKDDGHWYYLPEARIKAPKVPASS
jgi:hypothetical protein